MFVRLVLTFLSFLWKFSTYSFSRKNSCLFSHNFRAIVFTSSPPSQTSRVCTFTLIIFSSFYRPQQQPQAQPAKKPAQPAKQYPQQQYQPQASPAQQPAFQQQQPAFQQQPRPVQQPAVQQQPRPVQQPAVQQQPRPVQQPAFQQVNFCQPVYFR
jgi:hypothetical protein